MARKTPISRYRNIGIVLTSMQVKPLLQNAFCSTPVSHKDW